MALKDKGKEKQRFHRASKEQVEKRSRQSGGLKSWFISDDIKTFVPKEGGKGNIMRILPATWEGAEHWGYDVYVHFGIGSNNSAFLCLDIMKGEPCPICEEKKRATKARDSSEEYLAKLEPTKRVMMYIIDRRNEDDGVLLWSAPWTIDKEICKKAVSKKTGELYILDDIDEGYDVIIDREGQGLKTKYSVEIDRDASPLGEHSELWLEHIEETPIPDALVFSDYESITKEFESGGLYVSKPMDEKSGSATAGKKTDRVKPKIVDDPEPEPNTEPEPELEDEPTWDSIHDMKRKALLELAEDNDISIDEDLDGEEIADTICAELGIKKKTVAKSESGKERLRKLRETK